MKASHLTAVLSLTLGLLTTSACRKERPAEPASTAVHVKGTPHTDEVLAAWRTAGLTPEGFGPMNPMIEKATYCERGKVNFVDTTLCEFESDQALDTGVQKVRQEWERIDAHTGVVVRAKFTLLAVVDRERREPSGKTISQIINVFSKL
jgi:hypothetical protein